MLKVNEIKKMMTEYEKNNGEYYNEDKLIRFLECYTAVSDNGMWFDTDILVKDIKSNDDLMYNIMNIEGRDLSAITRKYPDYYSITEVIVFSMGLLFASTCSPLIEEAIQYFCKTGPISSKILKGYLDGKTEDLEDDDWKFYEEEVDLLFQIADTWCDKLETTPFKVI